MSHVTDSNKDVFCLKKKLATEDLKNIQILGNNSIENEGVRILTLSEE